MPTASSTTATRAAAVAAVVGAPILAALSTYWLTNSGLALVAGGWFTEGWEDVAATALAALALGVALLSTALSGLVLRHRSWLIGYLVASAVLVGRALIDALGGDDATTATATAAAVGGILVAVWLPVGARWLVRRQDTPPDDDGAPPLVPLSRRAAVVTGLVVAVVVVTVVAVLTTVPDSVFPPDVAGLTAVLALVAAVASGRAPQFILLALLAVTGLVVVVFDLASGEYGGLAVASALLVVVVAYAWRPLAVRFSRRPEPAAAP